MYSMPGPDNTWTLSLNCEPSENQLELASLGSWASGKATYWAVLDR